MLKFEYCKCEEGEEYTVRLDREGAPQIESVPEAAAVEVRSGADL